MCVAYSAALVVRDHHDGLAVLAVELLQQSQDLLRGLAVEVAGRLVADEERRVRNDRAHGDSLLLAAGELGRAVLGAVTETDQLERDPRVALALGGRELVSSNGSSTFFCAVSVGIRL